MQIVSEISLQLSKFISTLKKRVMFDATNSMDIISLNWHPINNYTKQFIVVFHIKFYKAIDQT